MKDLVELGGKQRKQGGTVVSSWQVFLKWFFDVLEDVLQNGLNSHNHLRFEQQPDRISGRERLVALMEQEQSILWPKL